MKNGSMTFVALLCTLCLMGTELVRAQDEVVSDAQLSQPDAAGVFPSLVHQGEITEFLKALSVMSQKNIVPSRSVRGPVSVNLYDVTFREALDAVLAANGYGYDEKGSFIFVYTDKELEQIKASAKRMVSRVFVLNYIPPQDAEKIIDPLLSSNAKITTSPESGTRELDTGDKWAVGDCLIVMDYPENLDKIAKVLEDLDRRPPQVLIEATILVANVSDDNKLGVDFNFLSGFDGMGYVFGNVENNFDLDVSDEIAETVTRGTNVVTEGGSEGIKVGIFQNSMEIIVEAIESITDVVTLGNPKIMTLNRQMGKVLVGNSDGYITTEVSQTTATQTVQFLDTGTELAFRPFVMSDGYIRLELFTKDSDGGVEVQGSFTLPSETTAEVNSNVLVKDGHTIVIGGLFRERTSITRSQIPVLGNIPGVGALFRESNDVASKEEVIFLITPHIVNDELNAAATREAIENIDTLRLGIRDGLQWHGRDYLATGLYQRAKADQEKGRTFLALYHATLATQCNPFFLDAVVLREDLRARRVYEEEYGSMQYYMRNLLSRQEQMVLQHTLEPDAPPAWMLDPHNGIEMAWDSLSDPVAGDSEQVTEESQTAEPTGEETSATEEATEEAFDEEVTEESADQSDADFEELVEWAQQDQAAEDAGSETEATEEEAVEGPEEAEESPAADEGSESTDDSSEDTEAVEDAQEEGSEEVEDPWWDQ